MPDYTQILPHSTQGSQESHICQKHPTRSTRLLTPNWGSGSMPSHMFSIIGTFLVFYVYFKLLEQ